MKLPKLPVVIYCPYCGSKDIQENHTFEGHMIKATDVTCLECDEDFNVSHVRKVN